MGDQIQSWYPIQIENIREKIGKKLSKKKRNKRIIENQSIGTFPNVKQQINKYEEKVIRVDGEIPTELEVNKKDSFLFISYEQSVLSHGLHKYPAKFFPELPRWLIKKYSKVNDKILDPFMGSGTTNIEALLNQRHSVGIDIDPFSRFLSKVKTTPLDENLLKQNLNYLLENLIKYKPSLVKQSDIPEFPYRDNWFIEEIIFELAFIKKLINEISDKDINDFFLICFSSIIRSVSNADDNCTRTVVRKKLNKVVYPSMALTKFAETILINVHKMIDFSKICPKNTVLEIPKDCDARNIKFENEYFDLGVTSPPYVNAVDYPRTHQLEIYWLGILSGSLTPLKKTHIGTESVSSKDYSHLHKIHCKEADVAIEKIYEKDKRRAYIAYKYLKDMEQNLREVYRVLKSDGKYILVLGNNRIRNVLFENWRYVMKLGETVGFRLETYFGSEIIRHFIKVPREERINTDWVLVLKK